jgi:hypothetical protein
MADIETFTPQWVDFDSNAAAFVQENFEFLKNFAVNYESKFDAALADLGDLGAVSLVPPTQMTEVGVISLAPPSAPPAFNTPTVDFNVAPIDTGTEGAIYQPAFGTAPAFDVPAPMITEGDEPGSAPTFNEATPALPNRDIPAAPPLVLPSVPVFNVIENVVWNPLAMPEWTSALPEFTIIPPDGQLEFNEEGYVSETLAAVQQKIVNCLMGIDRIGLPQAVWEAIYTSATMQADADEAQMVETAVEEYAARGWLLPQGPLLKRTQAARFQASKIRAALFRDLWVKRAQEEIEAVKFYVAQGIALEQLLVEAYNARMDRALKYAEASVRVAIDLMQAELAAYNGRLAAYQASAQVYELQIRSQLLMLEERKFALEQNRFLLEQDRNDVALYSAQVDAAGKVLQAYETQMKGVLAQLEFDRLQVQIFGEKVKVFQAQTGAWKTAWEGYSAHMQGQVAKAQVYTAQVGGFSALVQAHGEEVRAELAKVEASGKALEYDIERLKADTQRYAAEMEARTKTYSAQVEGEKLPFLAYNALTEAYSAQVRAVEMEYAAKIKNNEAIAQVANDAARLTVAQLDAAKQSNIEIAKGKLGAISQVIAASLGGLNAQVGMSDQNEHSMQMSARGGVDWSYQKTINPV